MDDILLAYADRVILQEALQKLEETLQNEGLKIAPEKIQVNPPITYLGRLLNSETVTHQPLQLRTDHLNTLNDFQKLLRDINLIRPCLRLTATELKPLFNILQGNADPSSPRTLTPEAKEALAQVRQALQQSQIPRLNYAKGWQLILLPTAVAPTGVLWQNGPLE